MTDELPIHLRVPAITKARWVRESRAAGMRLSDWIIQRMEAPTMKKTTTIAIPAGLDFSALALARDPRTGDVSFDTTVIAQIEAASGLPEGHFMGQDEDALAQLITGWYRMHLAAGGMRDPVADDLMAEAAAEDAVGQPYSHQPGRA